MKILLIFTIFILSIIITFTSAQQQGPYPVSSEWNYYLEGVRSEEWPSCSFRFLSFNTPACNLVNLWDGPGGNQEFLFKSANSSSSSSSFYLYPKNCDAKVVAYNPNDCSDISLSLIDKSSSSHDDSSKIFTFESVPGRAGTYQIVAAGRQAKCGNNGHIALSFNENCASVGPDAVFLSTIGNNNNNWRAVPASSTTKKLVNPNTDGFCADPFIWKEQNSPSNRHFISCTGGDITLYAWEGSQLNHTSQFKHVSGQALSSKNQPSWLQQNARWAPETIFPNPGNNDLEVMILCDQQPGDNQPHRVGYAISKKGTGSGNFDTFSPQHLQLSPGDAGDIDAHFFVDPTDKKEYLVWKSDDNRIGQLRTHIWAQEISINKDSGVISQLSSPKVLMDSCCLWWIVGFNGVDSSLVEGPEMHYHNGFYYLFYAAGRYSDYSYAEGVARSKSIWGPYEKLGVPMINTAMTGFDAKQSGNNKILGPGHAGYLWDENDSSKGMAAYHAHVDGVARTVYLSEVVFDEGFDGWPRAKMSGNF